MRIYTCTPVSFSGGIGFFSRDSGLLCRGFQKVGIESRAVMPGARRPDDFDDLIRTNYQNLESPEWWRSLEIDGLVLYAWGRPRFRKVAAAIREAGIFLVLNLDSGGSVSPRTGFQEWLRGQRIYSGAAGLPLVAKASQTWLKALIFTDPLRARHLKCGHVIGCVSPAAAEYFRRLCRVYGGDRLAERVEVIPHSVEPAFAWSGKTKLRQIACVGRWSARIQKRGWLLIDVMDEMLARDERINITIAGERSKEIEEWHCGLNDNKRARVSLPGIIGREELAKLMDGSQVFYSSSAFESFGIAAAEALCSGCSVVAGPSPAMPAFGWFVSEESGRLAASDDCAGHAEALLNELALWESGGRDAERISAIWRSRLHADQVARRIVELKQG